MWGAGGRRKGCHREKARPEAVEENDDSTMAAFPPTANIKSGMSEGNSAAEFRVKRLRHFIWEAAQKITSDTIKQDQRPP